MTLVNTCDYQADFASYLSVEFNGAQTGGFPIASAAEATITLADQYIGEIWGRTGCDAAGNCATGSCPGGENCTGAPTQDATAVLFAVN